MAPMKRASSATGRAAKKSRTDDRIPTVVKVIGDADVLPDNLRSLLKQTLPIVLGANKEDRHAYETEVVAQAEQALKAVQAEFEKQHAEALSKQNTLIAPAEREQRASAKQEAEGRLETLKAKVETDKVQEKTCEKDVHEAELALKAAQKAEKAQESIVNNLAKQQEARKTALAEDFALLSQGTSAHAAGKKALKTLLSLGKDSGLDSTLLITFPITCKKAVADRSEFENMMFTSLQTAITNSINALAQKHSEAEPVRANLAEATASAQAALQDAKNALKAAEEELATTQAARKEAAKEVSKADSHLRRVWEDMRHVCEAADDLAKTVENFKTNIWQGFNELKERVPEPEPVEEPVAEEAPAEEAAEAPAAEAPAAAEGEQAA